MEKENFRKNWPLVGNKQITEFLEKAIIKNELAGTYIFQGIDDLGKSTVARYFAQILLCQDRKSTDILPCGLCPSCHSFKTGQNNNETNEDMLMHGDCHIIKKDDDKKNISIEQVRDFIRVLSMSSFLGNYKIGIIKQADTLSLEAANALLKTLEEPNEKVVIILITPDLETLPETIVSRSQVLNFYPVKLI
jgi:DNA polymerase III subunit delta'